MGILLDEKLRSIFSDPRTVKALACAGRDGGIHLVFKGSLEIDADGNLRFFELSETSRTNRNLTYSLWFRRPVAVTVLGPERESWQIQGVPVRALISGREFEAAYQLARERRGDDADLSAVWIIKPEEVREETIAVRNAWERREYPLVGHLDRFRASLKNVENL